MSVNATSLWKWARGRAARAAKAGKGPVYPTFREATLRFRCTLDDVENVLGDDVEAEGFNYLGMGVGVGVPGGGASWFEARGQYLVEAY